MLIYAVTQGWYSDYHIVGLFESKEVAEHLAGQDSDMQVEEFELNDFGNGSLVPWHVEMKRDGRAYASLGSMEFASRKHDDFVVFIGETNEKYASLRCTVLARDKEGALKIANERRTILFDRWPKAVHDGIYMGLPGGKWTIPAWEEA